MDHLGNKSQQSNSLFPILFCSLIAGALAVIVSFFISQINSPYVYQLAIPAFISVPIALLGAFGYEKGFSNLERGDFINSLAGGVGATIGAVMVLVS